MGPLVPKLVIYNLRYNKNASMGKQSMIKQTVKVQVVINSYKY